MRRRRFSWAAIVAVVAIAGSVLVSTPNKAEAAVASNFDPGYIISDQIFFNGGAMSQPAIQSFFESKVPNCSAGSEAPCLRDYYQSTQTVAASANCSTYQGAANERASTIIHKVAVACGINPQVLIVLLQKEQGLVTSTTATNLRYRKAMGYGCPDTASCDAQFYGFFNQVYKSAWQFKQYTNSPNRAYKIGNVAIAYHPYNTSCGAPVVNIRNQATANLYNYTPYQPNKAAMANLNGLGDSCSAYGNRNFWVYFSDWFGSPTGNINPVTALDATYVGPESVTATGWAFDPNTRNPIPVHAYLDGAGVAVSANESRPDVDAAFGNGPDHGFTVTLPFRSRSPQQLCLYAINEGPGANSLIRCSTVTPRTGSPTGVLDTATSSPGIIRVSGWALDPDTAASTDVHLYVNNNSISVTANTSRPDIAAAYPGYGAAHGFTAELSVSPGPHTVCAYGINVGNGSNSLLNCRTVTVPTVMDPSPVGILDDVTTGPGTVSARGWALDPETNDPISVHLYVGSASTAHAANQVRTDIGQVFGRGDNHGFGATVAAPAGRQNVCAYAINVGTGVNKLMGCRTVTVPSGTPTGVIDAVATGSGSIQVKGWALDPDTPNSIDVHVYVEGALTPFTANRVRPDIARAFGGYGEFHGFEESVPAAAGVRTVCVYAINAAGAGDNPLLGCRTVTVS